MAQLSAEAEGTPSLATLTSRIRFIAQSDTSRIIWTDHAKQRMEERDISLRMALSILRLGECVGSIRKGRDGPSEWKVRVVAQPKGHDPIGVAVAINDEGRMVIATVLWENDDDS